LAQATRSAIKACVRPAPDHRLPAAIMSCAANEQDAHMAEEQTQGDHSPIGHSLRSIRLKRAFGPPNGHSAAAAKLAATFEGTAVVEGRSMKPALSESSEVASTADTGLPQSTLDALCVVESDCEEEPAPPVLAEEASQEDAAPGGGGLSQAELDAMAISEEPDAEEDTEDSKVARRWTCEEIVGRARRLRAFAGPDAAAAFAEQAMAEALASEASCGSTGLSQVALDKLAVVPPAGDDEESNAMPEASCYLLRRARAFRGGAVADALAASMLTKAASGEKGEAPQHSDVTLPIGGPRLRTPTATASPHGLSPSPSKDTKDPLDQVATPQRRRKGLRPTAGQSPVSGSGLLNSPHRGGA